MVKTKKRNIRDIINALSFEKLSLILIISIVTANFFLVECADFIGKYKRDFFTFTSPSTAMDFHIIYVAAKCLNLNLNIYQEHPETGMTWEIGSYPYGPVVAYIFLPFTIFPEPIAYRIWLICIIGITLFSFLLFSKYFKDKYLFLATMLIITIFSYPFKFMLERGNIDHLIYLCLILIFYFYADRRNEVLIGLFLSIATLMKLYPGIFILYFLIKKEWRVLLWTFLFSLVLIFLTSSNGAYISFYKKILSLISYAYRGMENHSLSSVLTLIRNDAHLYKYLFPTFFQQKHILAGICFLILAGLYIVVGLTLPRSKSRTIKTIFLEFSILLVLMTITPNISYDYNLIIFIFATIALLYYYQSFLLDQNEIKVKDAICMIIFIFSTVYLYIPPVINFPAIFSKSAPLLGDILYLLEIKFLPLMLHFFLIQYLLLKKEKAKL